MAGAFLTDDLAAFFDVAEFGVQATPATGPAITVIFDRAFVEQLGIDATMPVAIARTADVSGLVRGSVLTIAGVAYRVTSTQPDGTGITTVYLEVSA